APSTPHGGRLVAQLAGTRSPTAAADRATTTPSTEPAYPERRGVMPACEVSESRSSGRRHVMAAIEPPDAHTLAFAPVLAAAVLLAGALDALTTVMGLRAGLRESNPLARAAFAEFGVGTTIIARVVVP